MKTIEYRTVDKSAWPAGPWHDEPDKVQWQDEATGYPCLIVRNCSGALCGYVGVGPDHPCYQMNYDDVGFEVHGGLTFSNKCQPGTEDHAICHKVEEGESDDVWWLGFDCAHGGDRSPRYNYSDDDEYRTIEYVKAEARSLARQLAAQSNEKNGLMQQKHQGSGR
jgi:hypothetical protein